MRARARLAVTIAATGLILSGCGASTTHANRGLESVHQPVVARADYAVDVATGDNGLAPGEDHRLAGWFDALRIGYGDRITIDDGSGGDRTARAAIVTIVAGYGLLVGDTPPVTAGPVPAGQLRVIVSRSTASVPGCPDWSAATRPYADGSTDSNYGCATNANLAAMIADPQDLIEGRHGRAALSTRANTRALKAYNELVPTGMAGTVKSESTGGK